MNYIRILYLIIFLTITAAVKAETISGAYSNISLTDVLHDIALKTSSVKIHYISNRLDDYIVSCEFKDVSPQDAIRSCIGFYPVKITSNDKNIFVEALQDELPRFNGRITDATGKPIEFANIHIFYPTDSSFITGGISNSNGHFAIPVMPQSAIVKVSSLGFTTLVRTMYVEGEHTLVLMSEPIKLPELKVTGKYISFKDNKITIIPTQLEVRHSPDIFQLLMQQPIPGLYIDPLVHSVKVMNREPIILVNGIRRNPEYLHTINPASVAKIEYTTDVPFKYITDDVPVGVLSIFLKERVHGGNVKTNIGQAVNAGFTTGGVNTSYNIGKSEFSLSYNFNRRDYDDIYGEQQFSLIDKDFSVSVNSKSYSTLKRLNHALSFGWIYIPASSLSLAVTISDAINDNLNTENLFQNDSYRGIVKRHSRISSKNHSPLFDFYLRFTPGEKDVIELQATTQIQNNDYNRLLTDTLDNGSISHYPSIVNTHYNYARFTGSWTHDISTMMRLEVNENGYYARSRNEYRSISTHNVNREVLNTISARLNMKLGKTNIGIGTGLRYIDQRNEVKHRSIIHNQSTLNFWMPLGSMFSIGADAFYGLGYPTLSAITVMEQTYDGYLVTNGNASLKNPPIFNFSESLSFNKNKWWAQIRLSQYIADNLSYSATSYIGNHKFLRRYETMNHDVELIHSISAGGRGLFDNHLTLNATLSHKYASSSGKGWAFSRHLFNYSTSLTAYLKNCSLTFMAGRNSGVFAMNIWKDTPTNRIIFDWSPYAGLNLQLGWWYIFNKDGSRTQNYDTVNPVLNKNRINDNHRMLTLGVTWNLNFGRKFTSTRRSLRVYGGEADTKFVQ